METRTPRARPIPITANPPLRIPLNRLVCFIMVESEYRMGECATSPPQHLPSSVATARRAVSCTWLRDRIPGSGTSSLVTYPQGGRLEGCLCCPGADLPATLSMRSLALVVSAFTPASRLQTSMDLHAIADDSSLSGSVLKRHTEGNESAAFEDLPIDRAFSYLTFQRARAIR